MTQSVEFFFDFLSPYSYLASTQLESVDADIQLRPMTVLKLMDAVGTDSRNKPYLTLARAFGRSSSAARRCARLARATA